MDRQTDPAAFGQISFTYATYADRQYREILNSPEVAKLLETNRLLAMDTSHQRPHSAGQKVLLWKKRIYNEDCALQESYRTMQARHLEAALEMYLNSLEFEDQHDEVVFRFVSLWFDQSHNNELNRKLGGQIGRVPTYKFVKLYISCQLD